MEQKVLSKGSFLLHFSERLAYAEAKEFNQLEQGYTQSLHQEVNDRTAELNLANKRKDQLFQLVGDNLRTPLQEVTALSDTIEHLPSGNSHKTFRPQAQRIWLTSFNLLTHLENLLKWARLKIKALPINPAEYVLVDIIDPLLKKYQSFVNENRIAVQSEWREKFESGLPRNLGYGGRARFYP